MYPTLAINVLYIVLYTQNCLNPNNYTRLLSQAITTLYSKYDYSTSLVLL